MRREVLLLLLTACGSRTGLGAGGTAPAATTQGPEAGTVTEGGSVQPQVQCTSAVQAGAPTPMKGYCSTRASLTPLEAPRHPAVAWSANVLPTESPDQFERPFEIVVDASGRAYVAINSS